MMSSVVGSRRRLGSNHQGEALVLVSAWLPHCDSSGVTRVYLFSSSFSSLFSSLCAGGSRLQPPPTPQPPPSCSTGENAGRLTGPDLTPTLELDKVACVSMKRFSVTCTVWTNMMCWCPHWSVLGFIHKTSLGIFRWWWGLEGGSVHLMLNIQTIVI